MSTPDFNSVVLEEVSLPYRAESYLKASFSDPILAGYEVFVIADSVPISSTYEKKKGELGLSPERLTTLTVRFPRVILPEWNTHRVFSRNSASSRARSVRATIEEAMTAPHIPLWTRNQKGMAGKFLNDEEREEATKIHLKARDAAVTHVFALLLGESVLDRVGDIRETYRDLLDEYYATAYDSNGEPRGGALSVHKQDFNRYLEPFLFHEVINTSSYWQNFINLRKHEDAQPAIHASAVLVNAAMSASTPERTWLHLPFVSNEDKPSENEPFDAIQSILFVSSTESAQISYRDKSRQEKSTATTALGERLLAAHHLSPFEHVAFDADVYFGKLAKLASDLPTRPDQVRSNFDPSWVQLRPVLAGITP